MFNVEIINSNVAINQDLEIRIKEDPDYWCIYCDALHLMGYSVISKEDALRDLRNKINTFKTVHERRGSLEEALISFGWEKKGINSFKYGNAR